MESPREENAMDAIEKSLKASFVVAANHITQLYTNSMNYHKEAFHQGLSNAHVSPNS